MKRVQTLRRISIRALVMLSFCSLKNAKVGEIWKEQKSQATTIRHTKGKRKRADQEHSENVPNKRIKRNANATISSPSKEVNLANEASISFEEGDSSTCTVVDTVITLRRYLSCMPDELWSEFFTTAMERLVIFVKRRFIQPKAVIRACEMLFCSKVQKFHTKIANVSWDSSFEELVYERLGLCRKLRYLQIDRYPCSPKSEELLQVSLCKLHNLSKIELLPSTRVSFHWAIPIVSRNCHHLTDFSIVYKNDDFTDETIELLCKCAKLINLFLYSFGSKSEVMSLIKLFDAVKTIRRAFHKELVNALVYRTMSRNPEAEVRLNLESLMLVNYAKAIGSQLVYVPNSFVLDAASICPYLNHLTLIQPSCLFEVAVAIPLLRTLVLYQSIAQEALFKSLTKKKLLFLRVLKLKNMELVTYKDIENISLGCPRLEEFEVSDSNLIRSGHIFDGSITSAPFPQLTKVTLLGNSQDPINFFRSQRWEFGKLLVNFLLRGATNIECISIQFSPREDHLPDDYLTQEDLKTLLSGITTAKLLSLIAPPFPITCNFIDAIVKSNCFIHSIGFVNLWDIAQDVEVEIKKKFPLIIKHS